MRKFILVCCGCLICAGFLAIFFFVVAMLEPTTPATSGKPSDTEAKLRTRIAELEAQVKSQTKQTVQRMVTEKPSTPPSVDRQGWRTVASGGGSGTKKTETFQITGSEWRIHWKTVRSELEVDHLQILVYDSNDLLVAVAADATNAEADTSYVRGKPGRYYLTVNSATNWAVIIEER